VILKVSADNIVIAGVGYPAGITLGGTLIFLGFRLTILMHIQTPTAAEPDNFGLEIDMTISPIRFGSWFALESPTEDAEGPNLAFILTKNVQDFAISGRLKLGSFLTVSCAMHVSIIRIEIDFSFHLAKLFYISVALTARLPSLATPMPDMSLKIVFRNDFVQKMKDEITKAFNFMSEKLNKAASAANRALTSVADKMKCGNVVEDLELDSEARRRAAARTVDQHVREMRRQVLSAEELAAIEEAAPVTMSIEELAVLLARAGYSSTVQPDSTRAQSPDSREMPHSFSLDGTRTQQSELQTEVGWGFVKKAAGWVKKGASASWKITKKVGGGVMKGIKKAAKNIAVRFLTKLKDALKAAVNFVATAACNIAKGLLKHVLANLVNGVLKGMAAVVYVAGQFIVRVVGQPWYVESFEYSGSLKGAAKGDFGTANMQMKLAGIRVRLGVKLDVKKPLKMIGSLVKSALKAIMPGGSKDVKKVPADESAFDERMVDREESALGSSMRCYDRHDDCVEWAEKGECDKNKAYMHTNCKTACGLCRYFSIATPKGKCITILHNRVSLADCNGDQSQVFWFDPSGDRLQYSEDTVEKLGTTTRVISAGRCLEMPAQDGQALTTYECKHMDRNRHWMFKEFKHGNALVVEGPTKTEIHLGKGPKNGNCKWVDLGVDVMCQSGSTARIVNRGNWLNGDKHSDTFSITQHAKRLRVCRTDKHDGWGMKPRIECDDPQGEIGCVDEDNNRELKRYQCNNNKDKAFTRMPVEVHDGPRPPPASNHGAPVSSRAPARKGRRPLRSRDNQLNAPKGRRRRDNNHNHTPHRHHRHSGSSGKGRRRFR